MAEVLGEPLGFARGARHVSYPRDEAVLGRALEGGADRLVENRPFDIDPGNAHRPDVFVEVDRQLEIIRDPIEVCHRRQELPRSLIEPGTIATSSIRLDLGGSKSCALADQARSHEDRIRGAVTGSDSGPLHESELPWDSAFTR
jgi:hypothetical protein